ncbi:MAG: helix-turn-helix domain-containing protein [Eubacteriales bacterium]|nr:helix-turn-helix domain-containing protein [Eubacteriales bacterium]
MSETGEKGSGVDVRAIRRSLMDVVEAVERLTMARVALHDTSGFLNRVGLLMPGDKALTHHDCAFCQHVRDLSGGRAQCIHSDLEEGLHQARQAGKPVWRRCHAGIWELAVPVLFEEKVVALFFLGQARIRGREETPNLDALRMLGSKDETAMAQYRALPQADGEMMERGALLLQLALQEVLHGCTDSVVRTHLLQSEYSLANQAIQLLHSQIEQGTSVGALAEMLYVSPASLSRAFRREMGVSLRDYMDRMRFGLACRLLREGRQSVGVVGTNAGFRDTSTFLHWFRRRAGCTPLEYRESQGDQNAQRMPGGSRAHIDYVVRAQAYLQENFRGEVRVATLAEHLNITPDHLARVFKQQTGETIRQALLRMRLDAAKEELLQSRVSIGRIAQETGFSTESAFANRFRKRFGMSPGEFRRADMKIREAEEKQL